MKRTPSPNRANLGRTKRTPAWAMTFSIVGRCDRRYARGVLPRRRSTKPENVRRRLRRRHEKLLVHELPLWAEGCIVAGVDEAGAGPLAGPVTAGCVVLDPARLSELVGVDDSKTLTEEAREVHAAQIREVARASEVRSASVEEIDRINILQAARLAMRRAVEAVQEKVPVDFLLVDAREVPDTTVPQSALIGGDGLSLSIAAASILAKVARDATMVEAAKMYPGYGFERHKGYATAEHLEAVHRLGVTPLHRKSFEPIRTLAFQLRLFD